MINYTTGNLLDAKTDAIVNTVNEVGVMGKGIALMFKEAFPDNATLYEKACKQDSVKVGRMFVTTNPNLIGPRLIINFPTKKHWRNPSKIVWIREGLSDLTRVIIENGIKSVAVPPLGCGNGGLEWSQVKREIEATLSELKDVEVIVYAPTSVYQNAKKREGVHELTPARAIIAELVRRYSILGIECSNLEVQKLAWFVQRAIQQLKLDNPLSLNFIAHRYGPYADNLRHLMNGLDGSYLECEKRLSDASALDPIAFNREATEEVKAYISASAPEFIPALEKTAQVIDGFESPLGMELLATIDWLLSETDCAADRTCIKAALTTWPGGKTAGKRKLKLFNDRLIDLAITRLSGFSKASV